ncbi:Fe-hydrogenase; simple [Paratrimastix pyriformis]|uniref:Fe-hydrogenase n=1 Tax=Paratrimastix pyriformis TaxID=342808 RepID=A0ABQ8UFD4_9EUKA|nr:Fe-hydrogenase; simple [Paratrimastix pyriformis]
MYFALEDQTAGPESSEKPRTESGCVTAAVTFERGLITRVARGVIHGDLEDIVNRFPIEAHPKEDKQSSRCCRHKDRAITKYRLMAIMGHRLEDETDEAKPLAAYAHEALAREKPTVQPGMTVLGESCRNCTPAAYFVTNACQGCVARPCMSTCPKKAISRVDGQAKIDPDLCVRCGACQKVCPYHAIVKLAVPCEEACPVGAIAKGPSGHAEIDWEKCIHCGQCQLHCPFSSVLDPLQVVDVLKAMKGGKRVVAMIAPAILANFPGSVEQFYNALKALGFWDVIDVSLAADRCSGIECEEFVERVVEHHEPLMTTSCCPAYYQAVKLHAPGMYRYVSGTPSPMQFCGDMVKHANPELLTCFVGPCTAKRAEGLRRKDTIDFVVTANEMKCMLDAAEIDVAKQPTAWTGSVLFPQIATLQGTNFALGKGVAAAVVAALPAVLRDAHAHPRQSLEEHVADAAAQATTGVAPATATAAAAAAAPVELPAAPAKGQALEPCPVRPFYISPLDKKAILQLKAYQRDPTKAPGNLLEAMCCDGGCIAGPGSIVTKAVGMAKLKKIADARANMLTRDLEDILVGDPESVRKSVHKRFHEVPEVIPATPVPAQTPVTQMLIDSGLMDKHGRPLD